MKTTSSINYGDYNNDPKFNQLRKQLKQLRKLGMITLGEGDEKLLAGRRPKPYGIHVVSPNKNKNVHDALKSLDSKKPTFAFNFVEDDFDHLRGPLMAINKWLTTSETGRRLANKFNLVIPWSTSQSGTFSTADELNDALGGDLAKNSLLVALHDMNIYEDSVIGDSTPCGIGGHLLTSKVINKCKLFESQVASVMQTGAGSDWNVHDKFIIPASWPYLDANDAKSLKEAIAKHNEQVSGKNFVNRCMDTDKLSKAIPKITYNSTKPNINDPIGEILLDPIVKSLRKANNL